MSAPRKEADTANPLQIRNHSTRWTPVGKEAFNRAKVAVRQAAIVKDVAERIVEIHRLAVSKPVALSEVAGAHREAADHIDRLKDEFLAELAACPFVTGHS